MRRLLLLIALSSAMRAEFLHIEVFMKDMDCVSCSDSLAKAFEKMRGVQRVTVKDGSAALELAPLNRVTLEQVWDTIKRIGFTPGETKVTVRGTSKAGSFTISVIDRIIAIEGAAPEGENVELKGFITPPPDPRTPLKLRIAQ